jgi:hypothetical protein
MSESAEPCLLFSSCYHCPEKPQCPSHSTEQLDISLRGPGAHLGLGSPLALGVIEKAPRSKSGKGEQQEILILSSRVWIGGKVQHP